MRSLLVSKGSKLSGYVRHLSTLPELSLKAKDGTEQSAETRMKVSTRERSASPERKKEQFVSRRKRAVNGISSFMFGSAQNQDLRRFLSEVGTDPREARYWLRQFQSLAEVDNRTFAVIEIDEDVFENYEMLEKLCSSMSFLHRHHMRCVIILGYSLQGANLDINKSLNFRKKMTRNMLELVNELGSHGAVATPLFPGCKLFTVDSSDDSQAVRCDDTSLLDWSYRLQHIPIVQSVAENQHGHLVPVDIDHAILSLSAKLQPRKVLFLNTTGGFTDEHSEIVANINLSEANLKMTHEKPWCTGLVRQQIDYVGELLGVLPRESSVVVTSAEKILLELFTHHGSGTFFKITEPIHKYSSLDSVDLDRLLALINRSFGKNLEEDYFEKLGPRLNTLYLSEDYNAAAIIIKDDNNSAPYLDKFAVSMVKQGVGYGEMLWDSIQRDFKRLFWRSRPTNKINPWYFKRCTGSTRLKDWVVFWYGLNDHTESLKLIETAVSIPDTFTSTGTGKDNTLVD